MAGHTVTDNELREDAGYFAVPGAHLYTVLHQAKHAIGRVLLVGPFAAERHFSYHPWVRWARHLAARGYEVLRYDYRGTGESTGVFQEMSFEHWLEDVRLLADWLQRRSPRLPLLVHGLEVGALLGAAAFQVGLGDGLLLWSPPSTANQALRSALVRWAGLEQVWDSLDNRKSASEYIKDLEQGLPIEVQGYEWSARLWRESALLDLHSLVEATVPVSTISGRPVRIEKLPKEAAPLVWPHLMYQEMRDLDWLYAQTFNSLAQLVAPLDAGPA